MNLGQLIVSVIITWTIILTPPLLIRYVLLRRRLSKGSATCISVGLWISNMFIFVAMGSQSKSHAVLILGAYITYKIVGPLGPRKEISEADRKKWNIPDTQTPDGTDTNINNETKVSAKSVKVKFNKNEIAIASLAIVALLVFITYLYINRKTI